MNCDACGTGTHVFVLSQRRLDDDYATYDVVDVYRTMDGAVGARASIWADVDFQEVYGGEELDHFCINAYRLQD